MKVDFRFKSTLFKIILVAFCATFVVVALWVLIPSVPTASALTPRAPIHILGDGDFTLANGVVGE